MITRNSALTQAKRARKRAEWESIIEVSCDRFADSAPTPEYVAALSDTIAATENKIRQRSPSVEQADRIIRVMNMTRIGHRQREISEEIGQSVVTGRRNLQMIRDLLQLDSTSWAAESETLSEEPMSKPWRSPIRVPSPTTSPA